MYYVVKKINGLQYVYRQRTYRDNGQVKTDSQYVGTAGNIESVAGYFAPYATKPPTRTPDLDIRIDTDRLYINPESLQKDFNTTVTRLEQRGINPNCFPPVAIRYGSKVEVKEKFGQYVVNTTRWKGNREKLRFAYRKALAMATLDAIRTDKPEMYANIRYHFDKTYQVTHNLLNQYLLFGEGKNIFFKRLALKWFRELHPPHQAMKPQTLGLSEFGRRKDWTDEFCSLYAEVHQRGIEPCLEETSAKLGGARKSEKSIIKKRTIFFLKRRKNLKKTHARIGLLTERMRKLEQMRYFFEI